MPSLRNCRSFGKATAVSSLTRLIENPYNSRKVHFVPHCSHRPDINAVLHCQCPLWESCDAASSGSVKVRLGPRLPLTRGTRNQDASLPPRSASNPILSRLCAHSLSQNRWVYAEQTCSRARRCDNCYTARKEDPMVKIDTTPRMPDRHHHVRMLPRHLR